jgi:protein-S-isoprenylcysteine O-methyltransferase Ste14
MALQEELEKEGLWLFRFRSFLPILILLAGMGVHYYNSLQNHQEGEFAYFYEFLCLGVSLLGLLIRIYTVGHTPKNTSGRNTKEGQVADVLNTTGIYSIVRHPLYLGNFFMWLGPALLVKDLWFIVAFVLLYWLYYERIMYAEEQFLRRKFGQQYVDWAAKTPAFIPRLTAFDQNCLTFSWRKVLKKEKNGLLAVFLIFMLFNFIGEWGERKPEYNWVFIYGFILSLFTYGLLKYLKRFTRVLDENGR